MELVKRMAILLLCSTAAVTKTNGSSMGTIAQDWGSHYDIRYDGGRSYSRIGSAAQSDAPGTAKSPGKSWSDYPESNMGRRLQASWCVEYSDILTYCCGAEATLDCEAAGGTYYGPDEPCEVVIANVVIGPASCTGLTNSSGVISNCQCGEAQPSTGGASSPGNSLAPTPTLHYSSAATALPTMGPTIISDIGSPVSSDTMPPTSSAEDEVADSSGSWRAASPASFAGVATISCVLIAAALAVGV